MVHLKIWFTISDIISCYSKVYDGLGQVLLILGIIIFLLLFHCNLRTIKESKQTRKSWTPFLSFQFLMGCFIALLFCTICVFFRHDNVIINHAQLLVYITTLTIFIPKYYISLDKNLQLYVCCYHKIPAPVLPWQLPDNFDLNSVKLERICIE